MEKLVFAALVAALLGGAALLQVGERDSSVVTTSDIAKLVLDLPASTDGQMVEVTTGPLANGTTLYLETVDGQALGSVSVFGLSGGQEILRHQIVLPDGIGAGTLRIRGRVVKGADARPATVQDLLGIQILTP